MTTSDITDALITSYEEINKKIPDVNNLRAFEYKAYTLTYQRLLNVINLTNAFEKAYMSIMT